MARRLAPASAKARRIPVSIFHPQAVDIFSHSRQQAHQHGAAQLRPEPARRVRDRQERCDLYASESWDAIRQTSSKTYGWSTDAASRRHAVSILQEFIREQRIHILCPNVIAELKTFVLNPRGRAEAASGSYDDDVMSLACLPRATAHPLPRVSPPGTKPVDDHLWTDMNIWDPAFEIS